MIVKCSLNILQYMQPHLDQVIVQMRQRRDTEINVFKP
jgi:hypothetical protein